MKLYYRRRWHYGNGDRNLLRGTWGERAVWSRRDLPAILHIARNDPMFVGYDTITDAGVIVSFTRKGDGVPPREPSVTPRPAFEWV